MNYPALHALLSKAIAELEKAKEAHPKQIKIHISKARKILAREKVDEIINY